MEKCIRVQLINAWFRLYSWTIEINGGGEMKTAFFKYLAANGVEELKQNQSMTQCQSTNPAIN